MRVKRILLLVLVALIAVTMAFAEGQAEGEQQTRTNTLYTAGLQWGPPANFNPLSPAPDWPLDGTGVRVLVYETLFMYNMLDGGLEPLLGESMEWVDDLTLEVTINDDAYFNDGEDLTAEDVAYSYNLGRRYTIRYSNYWQYIESVTAEDDDTVLITMRADNPNKLFVMDSLQSISILPEHVWSRIEAENDGDLIAMQRLFNEDPVASGPYKVHDYSDTKITIIRDDDYWGQSLFGSLPAPKFIVHPIFKSNDQGNLALQEGRIDVSQQFIPQVWTLWEDGDPIRTYLDEPPYFLPGNIPSIIFNLEKPGLGNVDVRRALAYAIDYDRIANVAMSGYSQNLKPALVIPGEFGNVNEDALAEHQWNTDVERANEILDELGAERGSDGIRVLPDGTRLGPYRIECPHGWTDWNASLEIVMENAQAIGIELQTYFPDAPVWENDRQTGNFDIIMHNPGGGMRPSQPWNRSRYIMYSEGVPEIGEVAYWNEGRYHNERANEIIEEIPTVDNEDRLVELYTELNVLFLEDIPLIPLMYRPWLFHTVNESVWEGFPVQGDGSNVPPQIAQDGAGIKALYMIEAEE